MKIFYPTVFLDKAYNITAPLLNRLGVKGLILDIDNTLTFHDDPEPDMRIVKWIGQMKSCGVKMIILSNNSHDRVYPFAKKLGVECLSGARKPLPQGFHLAAEKISLSPYETAVVGDQIFTDILGANLARMPSILVKPFEPEPYLRFRLKRYLEGKILSHFIKERSEIY